MTVEEKKPEGKTLEERISALESEVGTEEKKKEETVDIFGSYIFSAAWPLFNYKKSLRDEAKSIREDFNELDKKFDLLERYLGIEYFKVDEKTATYDWADKSTNEGFRKAKKSFEDMKKEKEEAKKAEHCCD